MTVNGIYSVLITGRAGEGSALVLILHGIVTGADPFGVLFDGALSESSNGYDLTVRIIAPANGNLVQGTSTGPSGLTYDVSFFLPSLFWEKEFTRIDTPLGAVNAKFIRIREM